MLTLARALRARNSRSIAFVGAGGKTTAMLQLANELSSAIIATTTHLGRWQLGVDMRGGSAPRVIEWLAGKKPKDLEKALDSGITAVVGPLEEGSDRYGGLWPDQIQQLDEAARKHDMPLLIEADGARGRRIKAPAAHEPVIPGFVEQVVVVTGISALENPRDWNQIHRPDKFAALAGIPLGGEIKIESIARVMTHHDGGLKGIPEQAWRTALINQADTPSLQSQGSDLGGRLLTDYDAAVVARLSSNKVFAAHEKIAGIILAGGESRRLGRPKQLLDYQGKPFVRVVAEKALSAGLDPVVVVSGSGAEAVETALAGCPVIISRNSNWQSGQASSIRTGLSIIERLPNGKKVGGAIFLLVDMPQVTREVLRALVEFHAMDLQAVVAPLIAGQRANPILFDQITFTELMKLEGDEGGRGVFSKYPPTYLPWLDESLLHDVDTADDYANLMQHD